jgi:hypothetical protein
MTYRPHDVELELRDVADGAETSTTAELPIEFDGLKAGTFKAVLNVTALDTGSGNETYALSVETDSAVGFASPVTVGSRDITATGTYEIPLSQELIASLDSGAAFMRVKATLGGTTPSITYGAFLAPTA